MAESRALAPHLSDGVKQQTALRSHTETHSRSLAGQRTAHAPRRDQVRFAIASGTGLVGSTRTASLVSAASGGRWLEERNLGREMARRAQPRAADG
jgi:hypothetical protein